MQRRAALRLRPRRTPQLPTHLRQDHAFVKICAAEQVLNHRAQRPKRVLLAHKQHERGCQKVEALAVAHGAVARRVRAQDAAQRGAPRVVHGGVPRERAVLRGRAGVGDQTAFSSRSACLAPIHAATAAPHHPPGPCQSVP